MGKIITYRNNPGKQVFAQMMLNNGERILISISTKIQILKLKFFGLIPVSEIWQHNTLDFFDLINNNNYFDHPLDFLTENSKDCSSINELKIKLIKLVKDLENLSLKKF